MSIVTDDMVLEIASVYFHETARGRSPWRAMLEAVASMIRKAAHEEAAKVADNFTPAQWIAHDMRIGTFPHQGMPGYAIAAAIRALSERKTMSTHERNHDMTDEQIKHMVSRFLAWRLPEDFAPDGGISFQRMFNEHTPWEPIGTNLLNYEQAKAMVLYMLEGLPEEKP